MALSDGSDLVVGEKMKIGMEFYIHYKDKAYKMMDGGLCLWLSVVVSMPMAIYHLIFLTDFNDLQFK